MQQGGNVSVALSRPCSVCSGPAGLLGSLGSGHRRLLYPRGRLRRLRRARAINNAEREILVGAYGLTGIVNLAARGMLVVSVARRLGSEGPLLAYYAARSNRAGPQKGALGPLS